jgi:hypothetical protein
MVVSLSSLRVGTCTLWRSFSRSVSACINISFVVDVMISALMAAVMLCISRSTSVGGSGVSLFNQTPFELRLEDFQSLSINKSS